MIETMQGTCDISKLEEGYLIVSTPEFKNMPSWSRQEMKMTKEYKPEWVHIYDNNKMMELEYPTEHTENHQYYIYKLIEQTEELGEINVKDILTQTGIYESDGTPIYVYKEDLKAN
jgi:hypothetical protein